MDHRTDRSAALAAPLITVLTVGVLAAVLWLFTRHNHWALVFALWVIVQAGFMYWQWALGKARVLLPWFVASSAVLLGFAVFAPVPMTTISMDVGKRSISAAVTLNDTERRTVERGSTDPRALGWLDTDWLSRHALGDSTATLHFGKALDDTTRNLEIRFGKHPARFDLNEIAVGSDILGIAYPLSVWSGRQIVESELFEPRHSKLTVLDDGRVELLGPNTRPTLSVSISRKPVLSNLSANRETGFRILWAILFLAVPCLLLFAERSARKLDRFGRSVATWLSR